MKRIKNRIEAEYDKVSPKRLVFTNTTHRRVVTISFITICCLLSIPYFIYPEIKDDQIVRPVYSLVWLLLGVAAFLVIINPYAKKQIKKLGINPSNGFFKHWANDDYMDFKLSRFYNNMINSKLLNGNNNDITQVDSYCILFEKEASKFLQPNKLTLGGGLLLLFILPIWQQFLEFVFSQSDSETFMTSMELIFKLLVIIYMIIFFVSYGRFILSDINNRKSNKYREIQRMLIDIKMNLLLKEGKENDDNDDLTKLDKVA